MDVIADWLWEVTQALQSEKVYSGSEQKKKKISHSVICTGGIGSKDSHATFTHTLHTQGLNYWYKSAIFTIPQQQQDDSMAHSAAKYDVSRLLILISSHKMWFLVFHLEIFPWLYLHFKTWQPGRPWLGHEEAFDATQQNLTGSAAESRRSCGALAARLSARKKKNLAPNESGSDANSLKQGHATTFVSLIADVSSIQEVKLWSD